MTTPDTTVKLTADAGNAPAEIQQFAKRMAEAQGCPVRLTSEARGYHLYLPCPDCLETHQRGELEDPKYAINVSKYLAIGDDYRDLRSGPLSHDPTVMEEAFQADRTRDLRSGVCMRTRQSKDPHRYSVRDLLQMATISKRYPDLKTKAEVMGSTAADKEEHWVPDPVTGVLCPPGPGVVVPISEMPASHPAVDYLLKRGYNLDTLWKQFRCSFCVEEHPEGENDIFYRKLPGRWKDTPQHRIIFYSLINGVPMTWQGRYPEKISEDGLDRYFLHPYGTPTERMHWEHVATRPNPQASWIPVPPYDERDDTGELRFNPSKGKPSKYRTAKYSNRELMGWDAALERAANDPSEYKWVVLCEGPLDAARVGPGGVALIGSSISPENAVIVASTFHIVFTAFDNDIAGRAVTERIGRQLLGSKQRNPVTQLVIPLQVAEGGKDIGDMRQSEFDALLKQAIRRATKGL